jgi:DNA processing protein
VIGTGADIVYPARNRALAHRIAEAAAMVSEFPLGTPAIAHNFPRRNRIISGLARGVLVIEAAARSGSLITARLAGEQGREVFAIPGSIHSPFSKGCHRLIKDGAKLVESAQDILEELGATIKPAARAGGRSSEKPAESSDDVEPALLEAIGFEPVLPDELALRTGLDPAEISTQLLELELAGRVFRLAGGRYQRLSK